MKKATAALRWLPLGLSRAKGLFAAPPRVFSAGNLVLARVLGGRTPGAARGADRGGAAGGSLAAPGARRPGRPAPPAGPTRRALTRAARLRAPSRGGRSAQNGLKVTTVESRERPAGQRGALRFSGTDPDGGRPAIPDLSARLSSCKAQSRPAPLPGRQHRRAKPRLSTDNEAVAAQHGSSGRMRARPGGGGENGWAKPRPSSRPYWPAPRFWARPLTDLSHCDRRKGQFLLGRGRSQG